VRRRHASHITVVLSKAARSGPSVCLRARAPCPLRVSCPGADRALICAASLQARACRSSCRFLHFRAPLGARQVMSPTFSSRTDLCWTNSCSSLLRSTLSVHFSADRTDTSVFVREVLRCFTALLCGPVQTHLCSCAKYCGVSRRVRTVSFVDDFVVLSLTRLHFSPVFPRFVSF
jgi:hypothetical protein